MSDDLYLQALQNFLKSDDWKESLLIFIRANCLYFENVQDLHAEQHVIWKSFQEIAENVVQIGLMMVGGSIEELEHALDDVYARPSRGPRDEVIKDIIQSLHTVEDFHLFARMMNKHCREVMEEEGDMNIADDGIANPYDMLMRMGFCVDHINSAYDRLGKSSSLEDMIGFLSGRAAEKEEEDNKKDAERKKQLALKRQERQLQAGSSSSSASGPTSRPPRQARTPPKRINNYSYYEEQDQQSSSSRGHESQEPSPNNKKKKKDRSGGASTESPLLRPSMKFIEEAAADGIDIDINELNVKFSTADSVLESYHELQRSSSASAMDEKLLDLAKWAADMKQLQADMVEAYESGIHSRDMCLNHTHGLVAFYQELEHQRQVMNEQSNGLTGDMLSDSELKRMAELDKIAAEGSEDEQRLHSLISRHEAVRKEIQKFYRQISIVISTYKLKRQLVEETYLFLKEQVGSNRSLEDIFAVSGETGGESSSVIEKVVSSAGGIEIMNLFLELQGLEEEQQFLKVEINTLLGLPVETNSLGGGATSSASANGGLGDDGSGDGGMHLDEIFAASEDKQGLASVGDDSSAVDAKALTAAEAKHGTFGHDAKGLDVKGDMAADSKNDTVGSPSTINKNASTANLVVNNDNDLISGLKQTHRDAFDKLKEALEADKLKKLHDLENRLLLRKKKLQQRKAGSGESKDDNSGLSIEEEEGVIQLLEEEIRGVEQQFLVKQQCLMDGLKYHCINELKVARQIIEENPSIVKKETQFHNTIHSKQEDIDINAVNALKEKYEHDKNQLLDYYANERQRQRAKMLKALEKRKGAGNDPATIEKELAAIDDKIDRELHGNLSNLREQLLLGLGGVNVIGEIDADNKALQRKTKGKNIHDDYDDYGDHDVDATRKNHKKTLDYVDQLDAMKKMYVDAGQKLQKDLFAKKYNKGKKRVIHGEPGSEEALEAERAEYEQLVNLVDNMVLDAYETHVMDLSAGLKDKEEESSLPASLRKMSMSSASDRNGTSNNASQKEMEERMKAGMLEAFEKAKSQLAENQDHQRRLTQEKLAARRRQRGGKGGEGKDQDDDDSTPLTENILEQVMDSFFQPPQATIPVSTPVATAPVVQTVPTPVAASAATSAPQKEGPRSTANQNVGPVDNLEEQKAKILTSHNEKEKALVDDLYATMMDKKKKLEDR